MFNYDWFCNPFNCSTAPFTGKIMEEFIKFSSNGNAKLQFTSHDPSNSWLNVQNENPVLPSKALKKLLPVATTYLCKTGLYRYGLQKHNTGADWTLKRICTFSYQLLHQTLNISPLLCKLILLTKLVNKFLHIFL